MRIGKRAHGALYRHHRRSVLSIISVAHRPRANAAPSLQRGQPPIQTSEISVRVALRRRKVAGLLSLRFAQADAGSPAILRNELDAGLFESGPHVFERTLIWLSRAPFKVRNCLGGCFAGS
jgi:hypothetical protein